MTTLAQQATTKPRIAIYGGAFDPVHCAHLEVARMAYRQASLDDLIFMPAAHSPLKVQGPVASGAARIKMLELALADEAGFSIDDFELKRSGVSYTIDTVRDFKSRKSEAELFWIIGGDQFAQLDRWRDTNQLVKMLTFLVLARPGYDLSVPTIPELVWKKIEAPLMNESSTLVRERVAGGKWIMGLLPSSVEAFIRENRLYT